MPHVEANGETLHYTDAGSGPAILLIHSMGADVAMWRDQVAALSDRYRCIAFDCRGHGAAPTTRASRSPARRRTSRPGSMRSA